MPSNSPKLKVENNSMRRNDGRGPDKLLENARAVTPKSNFPAQFAAEPICQ